MNIVTIAISTGGPKTLRAVLRDLPRIPACVIVVLHMPRFINDSICRSLQKDTDLDIRLAEDGAQLTSETLYLAPGEVHLEIRNNRRICLVHGPKVNYVCPSADVAMRSLVRGEGDRLLGVVMTGMGRDGVEGLAHVRTIGGTTIAQQLESCVLSGMPGAAIASGLADRVLTPREIRNYLINWSLCGSQAYPRDLAAPPRLAQ